MITLLTRKRSSSLALAIALATGSAVVATAVMPTEASAQRARERASSSPYTPEFVGAYQPLEAAVNEQGADLSQYRAQFYQLAGMLTNPDEQWAGGNLIQSAGARIGDRELQLVGMEAMLESGKVPIENVGQYNFIAYQLSNAAQDYLKARNYLQTAIGYNYNTQAHSPATIQALMAETYFSNARTIQDEDQSRSEILVGIDFLNTAIERQKSTGQPVAEGWYRTGFLVAYNNGLGDAGFDMAVKWVSEYPNPTSWNDAFAVLRNYNDFEDQETLDMLRLARKVGVMQDADYSYYADFADARRLPQEVSDVIAEGKAAGKVTDGDLYLSEQLEIASGRIAADRADLPQLEADANAPDASVRLLAAAGDTFLSYGEYAKAAGFYERALALPGVETNEELMRLGIAQIGAEQFEAAQETLGKVTGNREKIARMWLAYIAEETKVETPSLSDLLG